MSRRAALRWQCLWPATRRWRPLFLTAQWKVRRDSGKVVQTMTVFCDCFLLVVAYSFLCLQQLTALQLSSSSKKSWDVEPILRQRKLMRLRLPSINHLHLEPLSSQPSERYTLLEQVVPPWVLSSVTPISDIQSLRFFHSTMETTTWKHQTETYGACGNVCPYMFAS